MKTHKVSASLLKAAQSYIDSRLEANPHLQESWLDQCRTSTATRHIGVVKLETDNDWIVAFLLWYFGGASALPRESNRPPGL